MVGGEEEVGRVLFDCHFADFLVGEVAFAAGLFEPRFGGRLVRGFLLRRLHLLLLIF